MARRGRDGGQWGTGTPAKRQGGPRRVWESSGVLSRRSRGRPQQTPLGKRQLFSDQPMRLAPWHVCFLFSCIQPICPSPNCTGCSIWPSGTGRIKCSNPATSAKSSGKGCLRHSTGSERWHLQRGAVAVTGRAGWDSAARQGATSLTRGYRLRWSCGAIPNWTTKVPQLSTLFSEKNLESLTWQNTGKRSWHGGGGGIDSPRHRHTYHGIKGILCAGKMRLTLGVCHGHRPCQGRATWPPGGLTTQWRNQNTSRTVVPAIIGITGRGQVEPNGSGRLEEGIWLQQPRGQHHNMADSPCPALPIGSALQ